MMPAPTMYRQTPSTRTKIVLGLLRRMATAMGGTIIAASGRSVGFHKGRERTLFKLVVEKDDIVLHQVSGPDKGKRHIVGKLQDFLG